MGEKGRCTARSNHHGAILAGSDADAKRLKFIQALASGVRGIRGGEMGVVMVV